MENFQTSKDDEQQKQLTMQQHIEKVRDKLQSIIKVRLQMDEHLHIRNDINQVIKYLDEISIKQNSDFFSKIEQQMNLDKNIHDFQPQNIQQQHQMKTMLLIKKNDQGQDEIIGEIVDKEAYENQQIEQKAAITQKITENISRLKNRQIEARLVNKKVMLEMRGQNCGYFFTQAGGKNLAIPNKYDDVIVYETENMRPLGVLNTESKFMYCGIMINDKIFCGSIGMRVYRFSANSYQTFLNTNQNFTSLKEDPLQMIQLQNSLFMIILRKGYVTIFNAADYNLHQQQVYSSTQLKWKVEVLHSFPTSRAQEFAFCTDSGLRFANIVQKKENKFEVQELEQVFFENMVIKAGVEFMPNFFLLAEEIVNSLLIFNRLSGVLIAQIVPVLPGTKIIGFQMLPGFHIDTYPFILMRDSQTISLVDVKRFTCTLINLCPNNSTFIAQKLDINKNSDGSLSFLTIESDGKNSQLIEIRLTDELIKTFDQFGKS